MLKLIKQFFSLFKNKSISNPHLPFMPASAQEDPRVHESIKRTRTAFKQQEQQMNGRALKSHSANCKDPIACMKTKCFKWSPDKIVSQPYVLDKEQELKERKKRQTIKRNDYT